MTKSKLEKVLEYMVNGEKELASEMLHEHLIETARDIYAELAEEDDMVEEELDLDDEDEELDEGLHDDDESGDFEDDLETMEDELETEEYFGEEEDEDEDEAMDDLEGDMDMDDGNMDMDDGDMDMEFDTETDDDLEVEPTDAEEAMVNVEDAMDELRAAFADLVGDNAEDEEEGDEVADEFDDMDLEDGDDEDDDFEDDELGEDAKLHKQSVSMSGDEDGKASPLKQNQPNISSHGKAVNIAGGSDEAGGKGDSAKKMNVTGPQEQKGKMDKKVSTPSNSSEKAHSLFKDKNKH